MQDVQIIYISQPFGFDIQRLNSILSVARTRNGQDGISGALICRHDMFLQMLEGPKAKVDATFDRIVADDRHIDIQRLYYRDLDRRLFPRWEMLHDPARSWMWTPEDVVAGVARQAKPEDVFDIFVRVATEPSEAVPI